MTGNARHQAAAERTADAVSQLRTDIREQLAVLLELARHLGDLLDTRQSVGLGFMTPQAKVLAGEQDRQDRAAARGQLHRRDVLGQAWMNPLGSSGPGQKPAPVAVTAVSAAAELTFTLQHHLRRLAPAAVAAAARTVPGHGGRQPTHPPTTDGTFIELVDHLADVVDVYSSRPGLEALLRDLEHLEKVASNVVDGPAKTNHPEPCPWCGHASLVIYHRARGRDAAFVRCEGEHPCVCNDQWCGCQHHPVKHRHEWVNSGRATNTWHQLAREQQHRRDTIVLETRALDALREIAALHQPTYLDSEGNEHRLYVLVSNPPEGHVCVIDGHDRCDPELEEHAVLACTECQWTDPETSIAGYLLWPCPTFRATQLDTAAAQPADPTTKEKP